MNPALRQMIGEEAAKLLETADDKTLDRMHYVVKCETCKQIFFETTLRGAKILFRNVKGYPFIPFHWYINACRHFVDNQFHSIRVFVEDGSDHTLVKDLSTEWKSQFAGQKQRLRAGMDFNKAMKNELDYLEQKADKAYGKPQTQQKA